MVDDDGGRRLFGMKLIRFVTDLNADAAGTQEFQKRFLVGEIGARGVAERIARDYPAKIVLQNRTWAF